MPNGSHDITKQRTREHVIADLSVHYVEGFILEEGHQSRRLDSDYSYDLIMRTFDERGYAEPGLVFFQMKASDNLKALGTDVLFDVDIRDVNLWVREETPVILVLFDAKRKKAYWLHVQDYCNSIDARPRRPNAKSMRFQIPKRKVVTREAIRDIQKLRSAFAKPVLRIFP